MCTLKTISFFIGGSNAVPFLVQNVHSTATFIRALWHINSSITVAVCEGCQSNFGFIVLRMTKEKNGQSCQVLFHSIPFTWGLWTWGHCTLQFCRKESQTCVLWSSPKLQRNCQFTLVVLLFCLHTKHQNFHFWTQQPFSLF